MIKLKLFITMLILAVSINLFATEVENETIHTHDGFFLRLLPGIGAGSTIEEGKNGDSDLEFSGSASLFFMQVGGAISENLILYGELGAFAIDEPDVSYNSKSTTINDSSMAVASYGVGLSYYFMPYNAYVSGSINLSRADLTINNSTSSTEYGFGTTLSVGKEWWISDNWGIGVAFIYHYSQMDNDEGVEYGGIHTVRNNYYGIALSATYN